MNLKQLSIVFLILWYSKFFSCEYFTISQTLYGWISHIIEFGILALYFSKRNEIEEEYTGFAKPVYMVMLIPLLSIIPAVLYAGQSPIQGVISMSVQAVLLIYFILHVFRVTKEEILQIVIILGVVYCSIKITEQITYPHMIFYEAARILESGDVEMRNGFWRIFIGGGGCATIMLYYMANNYMQSKEKYLLLFVFLGLANVFLNLGRMGYLVTFVGMSLIYMQDITNTKNIIRLFVVALVCYFAFTNLNFIIGDDLIEATTDSMDNDDYIRWQSYAYYWGKSTENILLFLFGHGPLQGTETDLMLGEMEKVYHLYRSDIGIVGNLFDYGLVYCISIIYFYITILKNSKNSIWMFAFALPTLLMMVMQPTMTGAGTYIQYSLMLYLVDLENMEAQEGLCYNDDELA